MVFYSSHKSTRSQIAGLVRCLRQCNRLNTLCLGQNLPGWFLDTSIVGPVLASLQSLRRVEIIGHSDRNWYKPAAKLLQLVHSPVTFVSLHSGRHERRYRLDRVSICDVLGHMSSTLEVMHFVDPDYIFSNSSGEARIFGKLQCLLTGHTPLAEFDTRRLTRMFPKIRYLSLGGSLQDIVHYHEIDPALNSRLQTLHSNNIRHRFPHLWRSLDTVRCGDVGVLYALGLTCPIRHIELDEPLGGCHSQLAMWTTALRDCEASAISVTVNSTSYDLSRTLFPIPPNQPLTHLNLAIKIESGVSMDTIMENLIRLGKSFPLEYLSIAISLKLGRIIKLQNGKEVKVFKDTACSLAKMQTIDVARIFAEAVHTLRYFAFTRAIDGEHNGFHDSDLSPGDSGCVSDSTLWSIGEHGRDNLGHVVLVEEVPLEARYDVLRGERMLGLKSLHWARAGKATPYAD